MHLVRKDEKDYPEMSVIVAIEEAFNRHKAIYHEMPAFVLLGPPELDTLITEIAKTHLFSGETPLSIFGMTIVPKCGAGIDFSTSCPTSQRILAGYGIPSEDN